MLSHVWDPWQVRHDRNQIPVARSHELGGSIDRASSVLSAGTAGLVAHGDGQTIGEGKSACPYQGGANPYRNSVSQKV